MKKKKEDMFKKSKKAKKKRVGQNEYMQKVKFLIWKIISLYLLYFDTLFEFERCIQNLN